MISIKRYSVIKYKKERFYDEVRILVIRIQGAKTKISQYFIAINQLDVVTEPNKKENEEICSALSFLFKLRLYLYVQLLLSGVRLTALKHRFAVFRIKPDFAKAKVSGMNFGGTIVGVVDYKIFATALVGGYTMVSRSAYLYAVGNENRIIFVLNVIA